jgi:type II secretory pathway pseudopilin PulG
MQQFCRRRPGFTLLDVLSAMVIITLAIGGVMRWMAVGTDAHSRTGRTAVAIVLANSFHEYALSLNPSKPPQGETLTSAYLLWLDGRSFSPVSATGAAPVFRPTASFPNGQPVTGLQEWTLQAKVESISIANPRASTGIAYADATPVDLRRLTVAVLHNNRGFYSATWMICPSFPPPQD